MFCIDTMIPHVRRKRIDWKNGYSIPLQISEPGTFEYALGGWVIELVIRCTLLLCRWWLELYPRFQVLARMPNHVLEHRFTDEKGLIVVTSCIKRRVFCSASTAFNRPVKPWRILHVVFKFKELLVDINRDERRWENVVLVRQFWSVVIEHCSVVISKPVAKIGKETRFISPSRCFGRLYCINRILRCYSLTLAIHWTNRSSWCITQWAKKTCPSGRHRRQRCYLMMSEPWRPCVAVCDSITDKGLNLTSRGEVWHCWSAEPTYPRPRWHGVNKASSEVFPWLLVNVRNSPTQGPGHVLKICPEGNNP